ncbi:SLBB domain-containing protein [bacterium]|nr:SLBB domain-containing protein [candidate division CSSED10-310 bacterium]
MKLFRGLVEACCLTILILFPHPGPAVAQDEVAQDEVAQDEVAQNEVAREADDGYILGAEDQVSITVWRHDDLKTTARIGADGTVNFPLLGKIHAAERTPRQLAELIGNRLNEEYIVDPLVTVAVTEYRSQKVNVLGEVANPGVYYLTRRTSLLELLTTAGGVRMLQGDLRGRFALITHGRQDADAEPKRVSLYELIVQGNAAVDVVIEAGDTVYVPRSNQFFVFGEVRKPGAYPLEGGTTVLKAVTLAGGATEKAALTKVRILRADGDVERTMRYNLQRAIEGDEDGADLQLEDQDIIILPERFF